ncbi:MAG TPA: hypothetical protein VIC06_06315 [Solirubrobacteraceae bacterium]
MRMLFKARALAPALTGVTSAVIALALLVAPAATGFQSSSTKATGLAHSGVFVLQGGGSTIECTSTEGTWGILNGTKEATEGPQLKLNITKWNGCIMKTSVVKAVVPVIKACVLGFEENGLEASATIVTTCTAEVKVIIPCVLSIPAQQAGLKTNLLTYEGKSLQIKAEDAGIVTKPKECLGVSETTNAKAKATFTAEGMSQPPTIVAVNHTLIKTTGLATWTEALIYKVVAGKWTPGTPKENVSVGKESWLAVTNGCTQAGGYIAPEKCEVELKFSEPAFNPFRALLEFTPAPRVTIESN